MIIYNIRQVFQEIWFVSEAGEARGKGYDLSPSSKVFQFIEAFPTFLAEVWLHKFRTMAYGLKQIMCSNCSSGLYVITFHF